MILKIKKYWMLFLVIIFACVYYIYYSCINVDVINQSGEKFTAAIIYKGGMSEKQVESGSGVRIRFRPQYTSSIDVEITSDHGKKVKTNLGAYIEKDFVGEIKVVVDEQFKARVTDSNIRYMF